MIKYVKSGITPKGTIFIKGYNEAKQLVNKRVLKNELQFDAKFNAKNNGTECSQILITDWNKQGDQKLQLMPKPVNFFKKIINKLTGNSEGTFIGSNGKLMQQRPAISIEKKSKDDYLYNSYIDLVRDKTGYTNISFNRAMANIKTMLNCGKKLS